MFGKKSLHKTEKCVVLLYNQCWLPVQNSLNVIVSWPVYTQCNLKNALFDKTRLYLHINRVNISIKLHKVGYILYCFIYTVQISQSNLILDNKAKAMKPSGVF